MSMRQNPHAVKPGSCNRLTASSPVLSGFRMGLRRLRFRGLSRQRGEGQVVHGTYIACTVHRPGPEMVGGTRLQMGQVHSVRQNHGFIEVRTLPIGGGLAIDELCSGWLIGAPKDNRGGTPNRSRLATGIIVAVAIYLLADRRVGISIGPGEWIILGSHSRSSQSLAVAHEVETELIQLAELFSAPAIILRGIEGMLEQQIAAIALDGVARLQPIPGIG